MHLFTEAKDNKLFLKEKSSYYHQIQGQLYMTKKQCCDMLVWTMKDMVIIRIIKDESWARNIEKLYNFYFNTFIPSVENMA